MTVLPQILLVFDWVIDRTEFNRGAVKRTKEPQQEGKTFQPENQTQSGKEAQTQPTKEISDQFFKTEKEKNDSKNHNRKNRENKLKDESWPEDSNAKDQTSEIEGGADHEMEN